MKIKFDFWVTPDGYTGSVTDRTGRAQHVKGAVELPRIPVLALLAAIMSPRSSIGFAREKAVKLLDHSAKEFA